MIAWSDAVREARSHLGTPYAQMDCIALIRAVIRSAPGGEADYRCEGTNWLWDSISNSKKYRHLTWRQESLHDARAGMLAFKADGADVHHVGLVTGEGTVIHASSAYGRTVETALAREEGWTYLARHRAIAAGDAPQDNPAEEDAPGLDAPQAPAWETTVLTDEHGQRLELVGRWRTAQD